MLGNLIFYIWELICVCYSSFELQYISLNAAEFSWTLGLDLITSSFCFEVSYLLNCRINEIFLFLGSFFGISCWENAYGWITCRPWFSERTCSYWEGKGRNSLLLSHFLKINLLTSYNLLPNAQKFFPLGNSI